MSGVNRSTEIALKCVVVGDGNVGKTCLLMRFCKNEFRKEHVPTIFENHTVLPLIAVNLSVGNGSAKLLLFDTAGQEGYERLRILVYPQTDVFVVCFSCVSQSSMTNVEERWLPELRNSCGPDIPIVLVATQIDLREDPTTLQTLFDDKERVIPPSEGEEFARKIGAVGYVESSAMTKIGINEVFDTAVNAVICSERNTSGRRKHRSSNNGFFSCCR